MEKKTKEVIGNVVTGLGLFGLVVAVAAAEAANEEQRQRYNTRTRSLGDALSSIDSRVRLDDSSIKEIARSLRIHQNTFTATERDQLLTVMFASWNSSSYSFDHNKCPTVIFRALAKHPVIHRLFCDTLQKDGVESYRFGACRKNAQFMSDEDMAKTMDLARDYVC